MSNTDPFEIERQRERERFEKAKKIQWDEWDGPVCRDGYYEDVGAFLDSWDDDDVDSIC